MFIKKGLFKIIILVLNFLIYFCFVSSISAIPQSEGEGIKKPLAIAGEDKITIIGKEVFFNGNKSENPLNTEMDYIWDFGDGQVVKGIDVMHIYNKPGEYIVTLTVSNGETTSVDEVRVSVYKDLIILIMDKTPTDEQINSLRKYAAKEDIFLMTIKNNSNDPDYIIQEELVKQLIDKKNDIAKTDIIITWTSGNIGLNALSKFAQTVENVENLNFSQKGIVNITGENLNVASRIAQSTFDVLQPEYILLVREIVLNSVIDAGTSEKVIDEVRKAGVDHQLIGIYSERAVKDLGVTNFMSYSVNYLINRGVSIETIVLLLMLPLIATIVAFARQFLGIKTFGIYTPSIITLAFLVMGLKYGLAIFLIILTIATLIRIILKKFKLLYLPRMAIVLTIVALVILTVFIVGAYFQKPGLISVSIFPILILVMLVEKFVAVQIRRGPADAIKLSVESILVSVICYYVVNWDFLKTLVLSYPELILLTILVNILLGKWSGLRLSEYLRFKEIRNLIKK